ncbi:enoyl-CoA hydratase/isomerase family protein [Martelella soudanensis]|uniref:enoyl-CoA hydratase/isomerase family protein n=1 Tax=unclassified Martelella TaxID=2629616 RepID=UPI0015DE3663|nr:MULTISPECIES: enoyl-CoA hydratase/isomerase family protein [unclassified Martelella]
MHGLPEFETILLQRRDRLLTITFNRPEVLNAFGPTMHGELVDVLDFADRDEGSDVIVLTGAGRAFSAGGDLSRMEEIIADPAAFDQEVADAKRIIFRLLDIEKPVIARVNGPAVGLGATLALFCDVIFAAETARIGDPHVSVGLVAGDGGAVIWPQLVGFARAKEYLLTGDLVCAREAERIGLINHVVADAELDQTVDAFVDRLLAGAIQARRRTKAVINLELKRIAHMAMDTGLAYEALSVHSNEHRAAVQAMKERIARKQKS